MTSINFHESLICDVATDKNIEHCVTHSYIGTYTCVLHVVGVYIRIGVI